MSGSNAQAVILQRVDRETLQHAWVQSRSHGVNSTHRRRSLGKPFVERLRISWSFSESAELIKGPCISSNPEGNLRRQLCRDADKSDSPG